VTLSPGSTGILGGFFNGYQTAAGCTAGIQATALSGTGAVTLQPMVMGTAAGTTLAVNSANTYTLRLRIHCPESYRAQSTYYSFGDSGAIGAGGVWLSGLMGDGNGGRLADLEHRMECHEQNWQRAKGFLAAVSVLFAVIEVAVEAWHRH